MLNKQHGFDGVEADALLNAGSLIELLRLRAERQAHRMAYTFLGNGEQALKSMTYGELDLQVRQLAAQLQALDLQGERAILLYPPESAAAALMLRPGNVFASSIRSPASCAVSAESARFKSAAPVSAWVIGKTPQLPSRLLSTMHTNKTIGCVPAIWASWKTANCSFALLWVNQWAQLLYYLAIGLILYAFPVWQAIDREVIGGYALVFLFMMSPLTVLTTSLPVFSRAGVALQKVRQLGDRLKTRKIEADDDENPERCTNFSGLSLQGVTHSFHREKENRNFTLGPIDLDFQPGEIVFLIGGNGSGKTTLAMLLIGLYMPEQGHICWNGGIVDSINKDNYLQNFSVIFSDFYLFDELYGVGNGNNRKLIADYLQRLHLHHKVRIENGRFSSTNLSQGQRKRLALLVAYLEDRPFYVFDEWAADQDPEFKHLFYTELLPALKARGKTVLVISHDDRYFYLADRCIKLEEGRIIAMDKPIAIGNNVTSHSSREIK